MSDLNSRLNLPGANLNGRSPAFKATQDVILTLARRAEGRKPVVNPPDVGRSLTFVRDDITEVT